MESQLLINIKVCENKGTQAEVKVKGKSLEIVSALCALFDERSDLKQIFQTAIEVMDFEGIKEVRKNKKNQL